MSLVAWPSGILFIRSSLQVFQVEPGFEQEE
jgi:hypothetical protein